MIRDKLSVQDGAKSNRNECEFQGIRHNHVQAHKTDHEGIKFNCGQCKYQSAWQLQIRSHKIAVHVGVKFNCDP